MAAKFKGRAKNEKFNETFITSCLKVFALSYHITHTYENAYIAGNLLKITNAKNEVCL